jgi:hypothetical protein
VKKEPYARASHIISEGYLSETEYKVGYKKPPLASRFPVNRQNHTQKGPYLTCLLKKLIEKKIRYEDPETQKLIKGRVKDALMWRYILNGCQGDNQAIEGILDRIDGKLGTNGNGKGGATAIIIRIGTESGLLSPSQTTRVSSVRSEI